MEGQPTQKREQRRSIKQDKDTKDRATGIPIKPRGPGGSMG